jgi:hypothetical protein
LKQILTWLRQDSRGSGAMTPKRNAQGSRFGIVSACSISFLIFVGQLRLDSFSALSYQITD